MGCPVTSNLRIGGFLGTALFDGLDGIPLTLPFFQDCTLDECSDFGSAELVFHTWYLDKRNPQPKEWLERLGVIGGLTDLRFYPFCKMSI